MRNDVVGRFEPLDDLKAAGLLHEHTLARIVRVADSDHKPIRHLPNELALVKRDRHKLAAPRIQAFTEEIQPSLFITLKSPFVHLLTQGLDRRRSALLIAESVARREKLPLPWDPLQLVEAVVVGRREEAVAAVSRSFPR